jgi:hypothetical protein
MKRRDPFVITWFVLAALSLTLVVGVVVVVLHFVRKFW